MWNKLEVIFNDKRKISVSECFEITYRFNQNISEIDLPEFPGVFELVKKPERHTATEVVNGTVLKETSFKCLLVAKSAGCFAIMPAIVTYDYIPYYSKHLVVIINET